MIKQKVVPRLLADDMLLVAIGSGHLTRFQNALNATHTFLRDIGATNSTSKSIFFLHQTQQEHGSTTKYWTHIKKKEK